MISNDPRPKRATNAVLGAGLLSIAACLSACGGGSDGDGGSSFQLLNVSGLPSGSATTWKINRPIHFNFTEAVDFSSVSSSAIQIRTSSGQQALGEFIHDANVDPNRITFQPRCPTASDLSDAGLKINESYSVLILGGSTGGSLAVRSKDGDTLSSSQLRTFSTPDSTAPDVIFFDVEPSPPAVVTYPVPEPVPLPTTMAGALSVGVSFVEYGDGSVDVLEIVNGTVPRVIDRSGAGVPLNLYSGGDQTFTVVLEFDQPVNPSDANINSDRLTLQFEESPSNWVDLPTQVTLEENCTARGARVRLDAIGLAPKDANLRVEVASTFEDLVGQQNPLPSNEFSRLRTGTGSIPIDLAGQLLVDEQYETFDSTAFLDEEVLLDLPRAEWGEGRLSASFEFPTVPSLSPGFDWIIENGTVTVLNTGATDAIQNDAPSTIGIDQSQTVTDGRIFVRDFIVQANSTVKFQGPNPVEIWATGDVIINGTVEVTGFDADNQDALQSANAVPGAVGACGGGTGGAGSPSNLLVPDEKGGDGFGPFNQPGFGGKGGETAYGHSNPNNRRAGGGGGGRLLTDFTGGQAGIDGANPTPGNPGTPIDPGAPNPQTTGSTSAVDGSSPPEGGATGESVLQNDAVLDNFWGARRLNNGDIIEGELANPTPGSGGGGGGDSINVTSYPGSFTQQKNMRGAGGAGGGGIIRISCLGTFTVGVNGVIDVGGGRGGRGERKISDNRGVAGGSGGGSAGMMVLESSGGFDLVAPGNNNRVCFRALGGLGGQGKDGNGNAYGSDSSGEAGGGNGGGGIIQLHAFDDEGIPGTELVSTGSSSLAGLGQPNPQLVFPTFGARSRAISRAIPLGGATRDPSSLQANDNLRYGFSGLLASNGGTIPTTTGTTVDSESALFAGGNATISVDDATDTITLSIPQATADDPDLNRQLRNTQLLINYGLQMQSGAANETFDVASADFSYRADDQDLLSPLVLELELVLADAPDLSAYETTVDIWRLRPRFFRVITPAADENDPEMVDTLPDTASIAIEWQGLGVDINGDPDFDDPIVDWTEDPGTSMSGFNDPGLTETIEYFRYRVTFNNDADSTPGLTGDELLPSLDFLRLIFEF